MEKKFLYLCCQVMLSLSEYELAIAQKYSSNFTYICDCKDRVRYWEKEVRLKELNCD